MNPLYVLSAIVAAASAVPQGFLIGSRAGPVAFGNGQAIRGVVNEGPVSGPATPLFANGGVATPRGIENIHLRGFSEDLDMDGFVDPVLPAFHAQPAPVAFAQPAFHAAEPVAQFAQQFVQPQFNQQFAQPQFAQLAQPQFFAQQQAFAPLAPAFNHALPVQVALPAPVVQAAHPVETHVEHIVAHPAPLVHTVQEVVEVIPAPHPIVEHVQVHPAPIVVHEKPHAHATSYSHQRHGGYASGYGYNHHGKNYGHNAYRHVGYGHNKYNNYGYSGYNRQNYNNRYNRYGSYNGAYNRNAYNRNSGYARNYGYGKSHGYGYSH